MGIIVPRREKIMKIPMIDQSALGRKGAFYVGGQYAGEEGKHFMSDQMFVEVLEPKKVTHPYPVIMFHGAGQTNMNWLITPDGRMGWADYFVQNGFTVYLAEQPARARSAYHPAVNGATIYHPAEVIQNRFTTSQGKWPQAKLHTQWPGDGSDMEDETLRQFLSSQVEYLPSNKDSQALVLAAGQELLKLTGPAILLTHSQAGPFGWLLADACPDLIKAIVALEPTSPPFSRDLSRPESKNYGLAELPMHFEPAVSSPADFELRLLKSEKAGQSDGWVLKDENLSLPTLQNKAIALICSEASYHAECDHLVSYVMHQLGIDHDFIRLEEAGIHGNGHMMMLEKNNLEIAGMIIRWISEKGF